MSFVPVKLSMAAIVLALLLAPAPSFAQGGYDGVMGAQKGSKSGSDVLSGGGGESFEDGGDNDSAGDSDAGVGGFGSGAGFDEMYAGGENAGKDLYSYVGNDKSAPTNKRDKMAAESRKKRDEMVAKMKANSEKLLAQQKERAWKATHRGQEYPGEEEASDEGGGGDGSDTGGDMFGKDSGGDAFGDSGGGDDGGGDSDGGGEY